MRRNGFTLVETIVVIAIFTLLALGVNTLFTHIFISSSDRMNAINNIDQASAVAARFINEIRVASTGTDGSYALNQASDQQIIFYSNYGQSSSSTVARIRYYSATSTLYKGVTVPTGTPPTYNLGTEKITVIQNQIVNSGQPLFYYYDGNFTGSSTALTQPVNINQVKYVRINFNVLKRDTRTGTTTFTVSAGSSIRNLKTNLGN